ncbi:MAG: ATP-binding protein [Gammaproteobacteria bacterium]|jgi:predicted AAA+ superfamily ATPase|nr:ATP-binding protein [Gammaproteobacteria bacterium]
MIPRSVRSKIEAALAHQAAVALIGPRQVGKTTLAHEIATTRPSIYLDLEATADRDKLADPVLFLGKQTDKLVVLDEIHRVPALFEALRGIIDAGRRAGIRTGRFLILGSAAIDLLRQSGETLAGRIAYVDIAPLTAVEVEPTDLTRLWLRGGFPDSFLSATDGDSLDLRESFIRTYLERDVPMFGPRIPAETLRRLWTMLAHNQGTLLNASRLASGLSISAPTVTSYIDLLVDLLLVRRLPPFHANVGKRLVKSPKTYVRDSGLTHALLNIETYEDLLGHPVSGPSWEGFVIENLIAAASGRTLASFYRTAAGAEIDLLLELGGQRGTWAVEIKSGLSAKPQRGFYQALEDVQPARAFVVHAGEDSYPISDDIEAIGLRELAGLLSRKTNEGE